MKKGLRSMKPVDSQVDNQFDIDYKHPLADQGRPRTVRVSYCNNHCNNILKTESLARDIYLLPSISVNLM